MLFGKWRKHFDLKLILTLNKIQMLLYNSKMFVEMFVEMFLISFFCPQGHVIFFFYLC